jgi:uncharacterized protein
MALEIRGACERCGVALSMDSGAARICSYQCTFCAECARDMSAVCPNCGGTLHTRPPRRSE